MAKPKRRYLGRTLKTLFGLSGNQCAYPECKNTLIEPATEYSDDLVTGQICHIYAVGEKGPRGKPELTEKELNSPENLILLCPNHHAIVDGQHGSYPAEKLKLWKRNHEDKMRNRQSSDQNFFPHMRIPTELVDEKIEEELEKLRKSRFFTGFDNVRSSLKLAKRLTEGDLSLGSGSVRSRALAWCARLLSLTEKLDEAEKYLDLAKGLEISVETRIADAFVCSRRDGKKAALKILADIGLPASWSAALMIVANHEGPRGAVNWLNTAGIGLVDLDSDGKYFLLKLLLNVGDWEAARGCADKLSDEHIREAPVLHYMMAMAYLLETVPDQHRVSVLRQPPFQARDFPLFPDDASINERRKARNHFIEAGNFAQNLNYSDEARICEEYELWLDLVDPDNHDEAVQRLESMLRDSKRPLGFVNLGLEFGIDLDRQAIEREIEKQTALHGETTFDAARARLALILTENNPEDIANQIERYEDELERFSDRKSVQLLRIEILSRAGLTGRARECFDALRQEELSEVERENIQKMISAAEETDTVEFARKRFEETDSLEDLRALVLDLESRGRWGDICQYGEILFERNRRSLPDAERLANALSRTNRTKEIVEFAKTNENLFAQSENLRRVICWALYREGEFSKSRSMLKTLNYDQDDKSYRVSRINLSIFSGDWDELSAIIHEEYLNKNKRSARELIEIAGLAVRLKLPIARKLIIAGAEKAGDDIAVLATAYLLASEDGWEDDEKANSWLHKAALLSGDDGPIRSVSLRDMVNLNSQWNQQTHEIWQWYASGGLPIFPAAHYLNRSVADLTLFPAFRNLSENDPRRRGIIPAYSGGRQPARIETNGTVGIDATALLTLSFLGQDLLEKALDAFKRVYVPHSTLAWLFEEKQKIGFHQPSRIKDTRKVLELLATRKIEELSPVAVADSDLSAQIGEDLAVLIAEAERSRYGDNVQHLVVRSSPVYRVASFMKEEADLVAHEHVLCGCGFVIDKLQGKGRITDGTKSKARDYMRIHEKPWPNQPEIADGAVLYLDDSSITHFLHLGLLEELRAAGFRLIVSPRTVSEAKEFLSYERISDDADKALENIRTTLVSRIKSGRVKLARQLVTDEPRDELLLSYPIADMFSLAGDCDAIIVDDRSINQHATISNDGAQVPVFTTLDLLDELVSSGSITQEDRLEHRTQLRRAGYFFVPVTQHELKHHLDDSVLPNGKVAESLRLKAIRENILCIQMSNWLQFPKESSWADSFLTTFILTLKDLWASGKDLSQAQVLSDWILNSVDIQSWLRSFADKNKDNIDPAECIARGIRLLMLPAKVPLEALDKYWTWAEGRILIPVKEQHPDLYSNILGQYREEIPRLMEMEITKQPGIKNDPDARSALWDAALQLTPPALRETLLQESEFCKKYKLETYQIVSFGTPGVFFQHSKLCSAARKILSGKPVEQVIDEDGKKWELKNIAEKDQSPNLALSHEGRRYSLSPSFLSLSPNSKKRLRFFEEIASALNLPSGTQDVWRGILKKRALKDNEIQAFENDFINTPVNVAQSMFNFPAGGVKRDDSFLVPRSEKYFDRLVGEYDGSAMIQNYAVTVGRKLFQELSAWRPYEGFLLSLLLSSHSALTDEIPVERLSSNELVRALGFLEEHGDRLSQLGAVEVGLRVLPSRPEIEAVLARLIESIRDDNVNEESSGFRHLRALFCFVDGELSRTQILSSKPPFYRRLTALSQAALINRQLLNSRVNINSFCQSALFSRAGENYLQSLVDMRLEPRWIPDLWTPEQIKANFLGRIVIAAEKYEENIKDSGLYDLILGTDPKSVQSVGVSFYQHLPGPLEGPQELGGSLPAEVARAIEQQVNSDELSPSSFGALVNSARSFHIDPYQAELAVKALRNADYRLANLDNKSQLLAILYGLAAVAAVARSHSLADEVRILVRRYRYDSQYPVLIAENVKICLMAAASCTELNEWKEFVSGWMRELAFGELKSEDGELLHSQLLYLCQIVSGLWASCDEICAALKSYNALPAELKFQGGFERFDIARVIKSGESETVEFKSALRMDPNTGRRNKKIDLAVLKTIAGFLNTKGGTLIAGVSNEGVPNGIQADGFVNEDEMKLHLVNIIATRMRPEIMIGIQVHVDLKEYEGSEILVIHCEQSSFPVYVKDGGKELFFIRNGPSTRKLPANHARDYIKQRFT